MFLQLTRVKEFCLKIWRYREILREALFANAQSVVLSHNHPSFSTRMSTADLEATREIARRLNAADISLGDHIIVAGQKAVSFAETGIDLGDRDHNFRVSARENPRHMPETKKPSAREQLLSDKTQIAKEQAGQIKQLPVPKRTVSIDI